MMTTTIADAIRELERRDTMLTVRAANEIAAWGFLTPSAEIDQRQARRYRWQAERLSELLAADLDKAEAGQ
jgi:hypothetical protein